MISVGLELASARRAGGPPPFSPLSLSPALWLAADLSPKWQDAARSTPAVLDADPVRVWDDLSGNERHPTAPSDAVRSTLKLAIVGSLPMILPDAVDDTLILASSIAFTGPLTLYAVGTRADSTIWIPASAIGVPGLLIFSNNTIYFINDVDHNASAAYTGQAGTILTRFRRDASNVCKFAATGMAEVTLGTLLGTIAITQVFSRNGVQFNGGTNKFGELIACASDVLTDTPVLDASTIAYLARWGVTLP